MFEKIASSMPASIRCVFQEASKLSALSEEMEANGYSLHAVLHEELGWEEFATLFQPHPVYHDVQVRQKCYNSIVVFTIYYS